MKEHPPRVWVKCPYAWPYKPAETEAPEYLSVSEHEAALAEKDASLEEFSELLRESFLAIEAANGKLAEKDAEIESLNSALAHQGVDFGSELERRDANYISAVKGRQDFRNAWAEARERISKLEEALRFTLHAAEYLYKPDKPLDKGLCPTFYFTLSYEGDLELIEKTKRAREALAASTSELLKPTSVSSKAATGEKVSEK